MPFIPVNFGADWRELFHMLTFDFMYSKQKNIWQITQGMESAFHENWNQSLADGMSNGEMKENDLLGNMSMKISHC